MASFDGVQNMGSGLVLGEVPEDCKPVVIGIDFGTAYSGVAFAYKVDPGSIQCGAPTSLDNSQFKVPTALLQNEDGTWLFGNAAEAKYNEMLTAHTSGNAVPVHMYKRFKMVLKDATEGFDKLTAMSINGKNTSLLLLISKALEKLKEFALEKVGAGYGGSLDPLTDIQWVLTVPAIWNEFGKAFMRKAAFKAGMIVDEQSENLMLVLEPEGAALAVHAGAAAFNLLGAASRFMVLDCGGGTVDITVHEVLTVQPLALKAISVPSGGDWGGDYVNLEFRKFLQELLGPDLFKESELPFEFYSIMLEFDRIKLIFDPSKDPGTMRLIDVLENKKQLLGLVEEYNAKHPEKPVLASQAVRNGFLCMSKELMLSFFEPFLAATVNETRRILSAHEHITNIIVVGGFGSSKVLTNRINSEFHNKLGVRVILPDPRPKPQGAIAHGAVYYGLYKNIIQNRVAPFTYGVSMRINGVDDVFQILVSKGEDLPFDQESRCTGLPITEEQRTITWKIYRSSLEEPRTVTGEHLLGTLTAECPPAAEQRLRQQFGSFKFGGSEIKVSILNAEGKEFQSEISMK